jgi:hypothetical protein
VDHRLRRHARTQRRPRRRRRCSPIVRAPSRDRRGHRGSDRAGRKRVRVRLSKARVVFETDTTLAPGCRSDRANSVRVTEPGRRGCSRSARTETSCRQQPARHRDRSQSRKDTDRRLDAGVGTRS